MSPFAVMNMVWSDEGIKKSSGDAEHLRLMNMVWSDEGMKKTPETRSQTEGDRIKSQSFLCKNQEIAFRFEREDALFVFSAHGKTKSVL